MFAEDHVDAHLDVAKSKNAIGEVYNVVPGQSCYKFRTSYETVSIDKVQGQARFVSYPPGYPQRPQTQGPPYLVLDNARISREVGWHPRYSLDEGLKRAVELLNRKTNQQISAVAMILLIRLFLFQRE